MHTAFECAPLLSGLKGRPEAIVVHGAKLFVGSATGSVHVYRLDDEAEGNKPAQALQTAEQFSKRSIDQLGVIKETNHLVSLSDGYVSLHDLSTLELQVQLTQTRGALTFSIDTSIQKRLAAKAPDYGPGPLGGMASVRGSKYLPATSGTARTFRPGAIGDSSGGGTSSRNRSSVYEVPSKDWQTASMRGMDAMARYRDEERRKAMEGARFGGGEVEGQDGVMTLVTVMAVSLKRKTVLFRWVDGEFWDTREVPLQHTPRSLAFVTPTRLFMGYNANEYGVLSVPLASDSTVAYTHPSSSYGGSSSRREAHAHPPINSISGPLVDLSSPTLSAWHVEDFDLAASAETGPNAAVSQATGAAQSGATTFGAAFGGLGGYVGLGSKNKISVLQVDGGEVLFVHAGAGLFLGADGRPTRRDGVDWPASPHEVAFAKPYVFAILPGGSVPALKNSTLPNASYPVLQIRSIGTLFAVQTMCFPPVSSKAATASQPPVVRLLTSSSASKPPVYVVVTPSDRPTLEKEGNTIWRLEMQGWGRQIDELVEKGEFEEALGLLDSVDNVILEDKDERRAHVQALFAVALFAEGNYDDAIEMFMELDTNPARVIALYPASVAGDLSRSRQEWFPIFGGKTPPKFLSSQTEASASAGASNLSTSPMSPQTAGSARSRLGAYLPTRRPLSILSDAVLPAASSSPLSSSPTPSSVVKPKQSRNQLSAETDNITETGSIRSVRTAREAIETKAAGNPENAETPRKMLEALGRFLADRRRIFKPILEANPHLESRDHMAMSQIKRDTHWLLSLPNTPFSELGKEELIAVAQTVDTALFKVFLETKPALLGPLCRIENWCEVEQVEELLKERKKFSELIALYGGKEMHVKALGLLKQFAADEDDVAEKTRPTIQYLQNLGPEFIDTILETAHWVLEANAALGMEIFTADTGKVGSWPRLAIVHDLDQFDRELCAVYLEFIIDHAGEEDPELHDKLIKLYLGSITDSKADSEDRRKVMDRLLGFLTRSTQYRPEQILVRLPADDKNRDMLEARALLLGRMGQHDGALGIYVRKLNDSKRAEEYCKDVWKAMKVAAPSNGAHPPQQSILIDEQQKVLADKEVFLTLIKIYLSPAKGGSGPQQLENALELLERHAAKIDLHSTLMLLPPSVSLSRIAGFVNTNLRDQTRTQHLARIVRPIRASRANQVQYAASALQNRRVKVGTSRTCPQCHKRLGNSVVAVNTVTGSVLHYFCSIHG